MYSIITAIKTKGSYGSDGQYERVMRNTDERWDVWNT